MRCEVASCLIGRGVVWSQGTCDQRSGGSQVLGKKKGGMMMEAMTTQLVFEMGGSTPEGRS